jgi:hypothetical protein
MSGHRRKEKRKRSDRRAYQAQVDALVNNLSSPEYLAEMRRRHDVEMAWLAEIGRCLDEGRPPPLRPAGLD